MTHPTVLILMGSDSDWPVMKKAADILSEFGVIYEAHVSSAHRTPERTVALVTGFCGACIIVGAGAAAHLGGVVAAHTVKPVIAVPLNATGLGGLDALLSTAQMPSGIPVASMAIDGAKNAALFAVSILACSDKDLADRLAVYRVTMAREVKAKDARLQETAK
ncbi:MAG TPA: 5-(carboxyamino)imidazole ribonucleotide mutase [bacterium]|nr:5-(carboxyamino)imidazole ribonucleotide mutase [bacterium]